MRVNWAENYWSERNAAGADVFTTLMHITVVISVDDVISRSETTREYYLVARYVDNVTNLTVRIRRPYDWLRRS